MNGVVTTIDQKIAEIITNNLNIEDWPIGNLVLCLIAIVLSVLLCGAVGIERELKGRSAGLRTHLLVGVGSCIIMIISIYGFPAMLGNRDIARLAAQIITGVGFLGAGAIMHRNSGVRGLTTAGTIWIVMAIGIACGSFNFVLAIVSTLVIIAVLTVFKRIEVKLNSKNPVIVLTAPAEEAILDKILTISKEFDCTIHGLSTELVDELGTKMIQCTFQAVFSSTAKDRVSEYILKLERETKAANISMLGHR